MRDQDLVPPGPGRRRVRRAGRGRPQRRVLAGRPAGRCPAAGPASCSRRCRAARPRRRPAGAARPGAAHRAVRAGRQPSAQDRPFTVTEARYGVREESPPAAGDGRRRRIFFPHPAASAPPSGSAATDPMTRSRSPTTTTRYGQARRADRAWPCRAGRRPPAAGRPREPYLATRTATAFAQRDDADRYIVDRVARTTTHEIRQRRPRAGLRPARRGARRRGRARRRRPDAAPTTTAPPFAGLPLGRLGDFGAPVRDARSSALTERAPAAGARRAAAHAAVPGSPGGPPAWTADYPPEFRTRCPALAGYAFARRRRRQLAATSSPARRRYDFHDDPATRGAWCRATRDPLGRDTDHRLRRVRPAAGRGHRPGRPGHRGRVRLPGLQAAPAHRPQRQPHRVRVHPARAARSGSR